MLLPLLLPLLPAPAAAFTLLTFDVDGTLLRGSGQQAEASAHMRSFASAVGTVLGDGTPTPLPAQILAPSQFHGSTDGLICLSLAHAALGVPPTTAAPRLPEIFASMYAACAALSDERMLAGAQPLPGVLRTLTALASMRDAVACGLVTGNVEGIARKKMRAAGILGTRALWPAASEQAWEGEEDARFLGGFGSDFCSADIFDGERRHLDRAEQILIAARRAQSLLPPGRRLSRVVHVGDAPADVLAARSVGLERRLGEGVCVGMAAVATGSYAAAELEQAAGGRVGGVWEPVVLPEGMRDTDCFLRACGL